MMGSKGLLCSIRGGWRSEKFRRGSDRGKRRKKPQRRGREKGKGERKREKETTTTRVKEERSERFESKRGR